MAWRAAAGIAAPQRPLLSAGWRASLSRRGDLSGRVVFCRCLPAIEAETADTINSVGLRPVLHKRVHALSKGYNRRLLLALALLAPHPVLLMDEPFDGFDLRQTHEIVDLFRTEAARGRTFILAIHQLADAERVCDRLILLAAGRVRGSGTLDELRAQTRLPAGSLEDIFLALT
jgi:ABC-2 type transport system ATP-binding protein